MIGSLEFGLNVIDVDTLVSIIRKKINIKAEF